MASNIVINADKGYWDEEKYMYVKVIIQAFLYLKFVVILIEALFRIFKDDNN